MKNNKVLSKTLSVLEDKFASKINVIDFERKNPFTDYFVICEANNKRQIDGIADAFVQLKRKDELAMRDIDGVSASGWIAIDLYDVVVHVFDPETRAEYELDKLFSNYPQTLVSTDV